MSTFLFDKIVFGPVKSRRLGVSLGINLLPVSKKLCNFNCIYCECGWSNIHKVDKKDIPDRKTVADELEKVLRNMQKEGSRPDFITFAGNGEPIMHPAFHGIAKDTKSIRDEFFPDCKISLLSNSSLLHKKEIVDALYYIDVNILKLDTAIESTFQALNKPAHGIKLKNIIESLGGFKGQKTLQTLFIRGKNKYNNIDNTTKEEINALIDAYKTIKPDSIMVYSFERGTPTPDLEKIEVDELNKIASILKAEGFRVEVY